MLTPKRVLILSIIITFGLVASAIFSYVRLQNTMDSNSRVIVVEAPSPPAVAPVEPPAKTSTGQPLVVSGGSVEAKNCTDLSDYIDRRKELGALIGKTYDKREHPENFAKMIDDYRLKKGLPLPLGVSRGKIAGQKLVYDKCRAICRGAVYQVFVSGLTSKGRALEVLERGGHLKKLAVHESGLDVLTIDEINARGLPFRSWLVPMSDGPWFINEDKVYLKLDITGLSLEISERFVWSVVPTPKMLTNLLSVDAVTVAGCTSDQVCMITGSRDKRHFKMPYVCPSVVSHAGDEEASPRPGDASPYP